MLLLSECLLLSAYISLSTQSGNFWIQPRKVVFNIEQCCELMDFVSYIELISAVLESSPYLTGMGRQITCSLTAVGKQQFTKLRNL
jgi:hypothetical protein